MISAKAKLQKGPKNRISKIFMEICGDVSSILNLKFNFQFLSLNFLLKIISFSLTEKLNFERKIEKLEEYLEQIAYFIFLYIYIYSDSLELS